MATGKKTKQKLLSIRLCANGLSFWTTALESSPDGSGSGFMPKPDSDSREQSIEFEGKPDASGYVRGCVRAAAARCAAITGWSGWPVRVMPDTRKIVLVPDDLFDPAQAADYLQINNITMTDQEQIVLSRLSADYPPAEIVMVYDRRMLDEIEEIFGEYVWYASLFDTATSFESVRHKRKDSGRCFSTLYLTPANVYITIQTIPGGEWLYYEALPYSTPTDILYYMMELSTKFDILQTPVYVRGTSCDAVAWVLNEQFKRPVCV